MLRLIKRSQEYVSGYKDYCQELYDHQVIYYRPTNPKFIDEDWFLRTKPIYEKMEKGFLKENRQSFIIGQLMMGSLSVNSSSELHLPKML